MNVICGRQAECEIALYTHYNFYEPLDISRVYTMGIQLCPTVQRTPKLCIY